MLETDLIINLNKQNQYKHVKYIKNYLHQNR